MVGEPDPYAVLGVHPDASPAEISRAYRGLVRRHHPDTHADTTAEQGSSEELDRIMAAYAILRDPARRAEYDKRRRRAVPPPRRVCVRRVSPEPPEQEPPIRFGPVRYHGPPH
jgi:curved DNA-binding protein CbpA